MKNNLFILLLTLLSFISGTISYYTSILASRINREDSDDARRENIRTTSRAFFLIAASSITGIAALLITQRMQTPSSSNTIDQSTSRQSDEYGVHFVYAYSKDSGVNKNYTRAIEDAAQTLQEYFRGQMGLDYNRKTFRIYNSSVETCPLSHEGSYYETDARNRIIADIQSCERIEKGSKEAIWVVYTDITPSCDPTVGNHELGTSDDSIIMLPKQDLDGLLGKSPLKYCEGEVSYTRNRFVGGLGYLLAATMGAHTCNGESSNCDSNSLMSGKMYEYPQAYLTAEDKRILNASPFMHDE